jgi:hypothetical protein
MEEEKQPTLPPKTLEEENNKIKTCAICKQQGIAPFSNSYKIQPSNINMFKEFFHLDNISNGDLCNTCYNEWIEHSKHSKKVCELNDVLISNWLATKDH